MPDSNYKTPTPQPARVDSNIDAECARPASTETAQNVTPKPCPEVHISRALKDMDALLQDKDRQILHLKSQRDRICDTLDLTEQRLAGLYRFALHDPAMKLAITDAIGGLHR